MIVVSGAPTPTGAQPPAAIPDFDRYLGQEQDERRLFYVALTRSQKWVFVTHSPGGSVAFSPKRNSSICLVMSAWASF